VRWQIVAVAALVSGACETNEATDLVDVTAAEVAGSYELASVGGEPAASLDPEFCLTSGLTMDEDGTFEVALNFVQRVGVGPNQACRTDPARTTVDITWFGEWDNVSTLVVMTIDSSEVVVTSGDSTASNVTPDNTELAGEYNPDTERLAVAFPEIWGFNPHGGSGGKISLGGDSRGLGGGTLIFTRD